MTGRLVTAILSVWIISSEIQECCDDNEYPRSILLSEGGTCQINVRSRDQEHWPMQRRDLPRMIQAQNRIPLGLPEPLQSLPDRDLAGKVPFVLKLGPQCCRRIRVLRQVSKSHTMLDRYRNAQFSTNAGPNLLTVSASPTHRDATTDLGVR